MVYLEAKSAPLQARLYALLSRLTGRPATGVLKAGNAAQSRLQALAVLFSQTRVTLRLFGLLPMYAWFRQLLQGPKPGQDQVLYATSVAQCSLYMAFQFLENIALLTDKEVIPTSYTARYNPSGKTAKIYLWAYRFWFGGVLCDFVRLAREAQIESNKRGDKAEKSEDEKQIDKKWWSDLIVPAAWTPVAIQFSTEGGVSWFNLGIMGAGGGIAGLGRTASLWAQTADV